MLADLVAIPGGTLTSTDARTGTTRTSTIVPFRLGRTCVVDDCGRQPLLGVTWLAAVAWLDAASRRDGLRPAYREARGLVRWDPSADGYRLPTEAEWEHACRAGTTSPTYGPLEDVAWTADDALDGPPDVGLRAPNAFGLHDMLGTAWEWCWDYADPARYRDYRALRGGGWADHAWSVRAGVRRASAPDAVLEDVGLRVAQGVVAEPGARSAQGWSDAVDRERAGVRGPMPVGWTPLRALLDD